ncbi:Pyridoxamine 5'-phosphate oxidase family protein [Klebsormidium nitens]|uniref:Pyridoxamine 5'-phosphate oxidase family protein n=1 Tax=Klebsormidium nitens TaxID=105231 RepID=A0A1Y1I3R0_KLENI|nr:Pyridoxamine 5'-phosphate oxidase family protein [Klebsormidium nitens]|eukprot:GAQ85575.1 Pyridoxamine 5'-phosphate oxidase family protein [Klebsormidium nitens]
MAPPIELPAFPVFRGRNSASASGGDKYSSAMAASRVALQPHVSAWNPSAASHEAESRASTSYNSANPDFGAHLYRATGAKKLAPLRSSLFGREVQGVSWAQNAERGSSGRVRVSKSTGARAQGEEDSDDTDGVADLPIEFLEPTPEVAYYQLRTIDSPNHLSVPSPPPIKQGGPPSPTNAGRSGLFRTPISGGVQSATSSHGLPPPAVAVRNLVAQAKYAHLCTVMSRMHHRRRGYPFGSLVDFTTDEEGHPIFSLSPLAIHTRNILADPRCTLVVQIPGWSGLANARVTIFGDVYPLPQEQQEWAQKLHSAKHNHGASFQWGNFYFYRMANISDIYFVGGFGTVAWVDVKEYSAAKPDIIAASNVSETLQVLNNEFSDPLCGHLAEELGQEVDDAALISIDSRGVDVRVRQGARFNVQRLSFEENVLVKDAAEAQSALSNLLSRKR